MSRPLQPSRAPWAFHCVLPRLRLGPGSVAGAVAPARVVPLARCRDKCNGRPGGVIALAGRVEVAAGSPHRFATLRAGGISALVVLGDPAAVNADEVGLVGRRDVSAHFAPPLGRRFPRSPGKAAFKVSSQDRPRLVAWALPWRGRSMGSVERPGQASTTSHRGHTNAPYHRGCRAGSGATHAGRRNRPTRTSQRPLGEVGRSELDGLRGC